MKRPEPFLDAMEYIGETEFFGNAESEIIKYVEHLESIRDNGRKYLDAYKNHMTKGAFHAISNALNP